MPRRTAIRKNVLAKAQDLDLPLAEEEVTVDANTNRVSVNIDYHVPVDLKVYTLPLHFTHSSENTVDTITWLSVHLRHREARTGQGAVRNFAGPGKSPWGKGKKFLLGAGLLVFLAAVGAFIYYYVRFSRVIDARLSGDVFNNASLVFAAPTPVFVGEAITPEDVAARLRKGLYAEYEGGSNVGTYRLVGNRLEIRPGSASFFQSDSFKEGPAALEFTNGHIASITSLSDTAPLASYKLEPEVITTLFDNSRSKRRLVRYQDLPKTVINAVVAAEDHSFFSHHGVNFYRIIASGLHDFFRSDEIMQGGSTLTMQLARNIFGLTPQRKFGRKITEIFLALLLEQRLNKEQIFELYANQIYLGQRGSFSIYGFGEAASAYFNKDVGSLTAAEAALLAGVIRGPNHLFTLQVSLASLGAAQLCAAEHDGSGHADAEGDGKGFRRALGRGDAQRGGHPGPLLCRHGEGPVALTIL